MNVNDAAQKWNVSASTVSKYCREGFIEGAEKSKGVWHIPDDAVQPLFFNAMKTRDQIGRLCLIVEAIDRRYTIPLFKLGVDFDLVNEYLSMLVSRKLIYRWIKQSSDEPLFLQYLLTEKGEQLVQDNKTFTKMKKIMPTLISAVSEGATKAVIDKYG